MVMQLAEAFYQKKGLYQRLLDNIAPENVVPKAIELMAMLHDGRIDYAWEYRSMAVQHGVEFLTLDDHINLSNPAHAPFYQKARVKVNGFEPGTKETRVGKPCVFGITITNHGEKHAGALAFVRALLDPEIGLNILDSLGQPPFIPSLVSSATEKQQLPKVLQEKVIEMQSKPASQN